MPSNIHGEFGANREVRGLGDGAHPEPRHKASSVDLDRADADAECYSAGPSIAICKTSRSRWVSESIRARAAATRVFMAVPEVGASDATRARPTIPGKASAGKSF